MVKCNCLATEVELPLETLITCDQQAFEMPFVFGCPKVAGPRLGKLVASIIPFLRENIACFQIQFVYAALPERDLDGVYLGVEYYIAHLSHLVTKIKFDSIKFSKFLKTGFQAVAIAA